VALGHQPPKPVAGQENIARPAPAGLARLRGEALALLERHGDLLSPPASPRRPEVEAAFERFGRRLRADVANQQMSLDEDG